MARALSKKGFCSRSQAFEMVRTGRVRVNGALQHHPELPVDPEKDRIEVDSSLVGQSRKIYWMLNKPRGLVTTASDEKGRKTVYECLPGGLPFVTPVGRLDKASEGLLLFTNDSEWAARVSAPETHLDKTYHVQIAATADGRLLDNLLRGIRDRGDRLDAKQAHVLREGEKNTWLEIVLDEGKNRHIRRMFEATKIEVLRLVRVAIGPLALGDLPKGSTRPLDPGEKRLLDAAMRGRRTPMNADKI